jgi:hypothetical protein
MTFRFSSWQVQPVCEIDYIQINFDDLYPLDGQELTVMGLGELMMGPFRCVKTCHCSSCQLERMCSQRISWHIYIYILALLFAAEQRPNMDVEVQFFFWRCISSRRGRRRDNMETHSNEISSLI